MAFDLGKYKDKTRPVVVEMDGDPLKVSYRPAAFTPNLRKEISALGEDEVDALARYLKPLLASWDATDKGKPVPIEVEVLNDLGYELLNAIFSSIVADVNPASDPNAKRA